MAFIGKWFTHKYMFVIVADITIIKLRCMWTLQSYIYKQVYSIGTCNISVQLIGFLEAHDSSPLIFEDLTIKYWLVFFTLCQLKAIINRNYIYAQFEALEPTNIFKIRYKTYHHKSKRVNTFLPNFTKLENKKYLKTAITIT